MADDGFFGEDDMTNPKPTKPITPPMALQPPDSWSQNTATPQRMPQSIGFCFQKKVAAKD